MELRQEQPPASARGAALPPLFRRPRNSDPLLLVATAVLLVIVVSSLRGRVDVREPFNLAVAGAGMRDLALWATVACALVLLLAFLRDARRATLGLRVQGWAERVLRRVDRPRSVGAWLAASRARAVDTPRAITVEAVGAGGRRVVTTEPVAVLPVALFQPVPPEQPVVRLTADVELPSQGLGGVLRRLDEVYARQGGLQVPPPSGPLPVPAPPPSLPSYEVRVRDGGRKTGRCPAE